MKESFPEEIDPHRDPSTARSDEPSMLGRHVGPYRIDREIGRGGMGTVYEAWRDDGEFQHRVAVKLIKGGLDEDFVLQRFRNERQILAALDHPNIGRLLGGGTTEDGSPSVSLQRGGASGLLWLCLISVSETPVPQSVRLSIA